MASSHPTQPQSDEESSEVAQVIHLASHNTEYFYLTPASPEESFCDPGSQSHSRSSSRASPVAFSGSVRHNTHEVMSGDFFDEYVSPPNIVVTTWEEIPSISHILFAPVDDDEAVDEEVRRITENIAETTEERIQIKREGLGRKFERKQLRLNYPKIQQVISSEANLLAPDPKPEHGILEATGVSGIGRANKKMSLRLKSPLTPKDDGSLWEKIGTLGRKKKLMEVKELEDEGRRAIDSPMASPHQKQFDLSPDDYKIDEGKEVFFVEPKNFDNAKLKDLMKLLINWINDELAGQRIVVKDLLEDLYDGQILQMLLEKLLKEPLKEIELVQTSEGQLKKLQVIIDAANRKLGSPEWASQKWKAEKIHSKSLVAILYLLVSLVRHFSGSKIQLPENVTVDLLIVKKKHGKLETHRAVEDVTQKFGDLVESEKDAFDILIEHAPQKMDVVKNNLLAFLNNHLKRINLEVKEIETQLHDGVYLILLLGLLEGYFVPLSNFFITPKDKDEKIWNMNLLFDLIQDAGMKRPKAVPEDIVYLDLKATLRVLYNIFSKYKNTP